MKYTIDALTTCIDKEIVENTTKVAIHNNLPFYYKKLKNKYKVFCPNCQEYRTYDENIFKEIRYSGVCPKCRGMHGKIQEYKKPITIWYFFKYAAQGYEIDVKYTFNRDPKVHIKQVMEYEFETGKHLVREIYLGGFGWNKDIKPCWIYGDVYEKNKKWHVTNSYYIINSFINYHEYVPHTKKDILKHYENMDYKSNQKKLILDHLFNQQQIYAIKVFDLKSADEVYRNRTYIRKLNVNRYTDYKYNFNIYTLEYLKKNKIDLTLYEDYARMCERLGRKLDKPKDFKLWHDRLSDMLDVQKNKQYVDGIESQWKKLKKYSYSKKDITIKAFESIDEIVYVSKSLHNCMSRMYIEPYANKKCELYHLDVSGKPTLAIEIKKGKLNQCYADNNDKPDPKLKRVVDKWYKEYFAV